MPKRSFRLGTLSSGLAACFMGAITMEASGQYASDFESVTASAAGEVLTGQDGYYLPPNTTSVDYMAYLYTGNAVGMPQNPRGGDQFVAGNGPASPTFARAQRDFAWGTGKWCVSYDVCAAYQGQLPTAQNLGSFSSQPFTPGTNATYIHLFTWVDVNTAANWNAFYLMFDSAGTLGAAPGLQPGPEWANLDVNHWYRFTSVVDFDTNQITQVGILDLTTGNGATVEVSDYYLDGGAAGGLPVATGLRYFAGGGVAGNTVGWDNVAVFPVGGTASAIINATLISGIFISGGTAEVANSDDTYLVNKTGPGFNPQAPHRSLLGATFDTGGAAISTIDVTTELHTQIGGPTATVQVGRVGGGFDTVGAFGTGPVDKTMSFCGLRAADYVNGTTIEVRIELTAVLVLNPNDRVIQSTDLIAVTMN